ncbi:MAG: hypothetical protein OEM81_13380 [Acidimicrobiia bacterium]|nr:hypothetical protein [Acidimicrobiia bacterium]
MSHANRRGVWLIPAFVLALFFVSAESAGASCAEAVPIEQALAEAQTVFVGRVTDLQYDGRLAAFLVEDVWKGEVNGTTVVSGGPSLSELQAAREQGQDVFTSVDRSYAAGERYLVISYGGDGQVLLDNACSATQPFADDLTQYRPASAHAPVAPAAPDIDPAGLSVWAWIGLATLALGVAGAMVAMTLRQPPPSSAMT